VIPFIGKNDLSDLVGVDVSASDLATIAIDAACEAVRTFLDNPVNVVEDETIRLDGSGTYRLTLPRPPVREVPIVTELATLTTDETALVPDVDYVLDRGGILRRVDCVWLRGSGNIEITYTHGWDITEDPLWERVPSDIRSVALSLAKRKYEAGASTIGGIVVPLVSETIGNYSYRVDPVAIATASTTILTAEEMDALRPYRGPHVQAVYVGVAGSTS